MLDEKINQEAESISINPTDPNLIKPNEINVDVNDIVELICENDNTHSTNNILFNSEMIITYY
jgi:hypothetical protein